MEFRKVLVRISDGLGTENVRALKNLCYDSIAERKREEIDSGIDIFNILIEGGMYIVKVIIIVNYDEFYPFAHIRDDFS